MSRRGTICAAIVICMSVLTSTQDRDRAKVAAVIKPQEEIASYDVGNRPGVVYYNIKPVVFLTQEAKAKAFLAGQKGYCFTTTGNYDKLGRPTRLFAQKGDLVVLK